MAADNSGPAPRSTEHDARAERARVVARSVVDTPAPYARWLERQIEWRGGLAAELAARHDLDPDADAYPRLAAGMALLAFESVLTQWRPGNDEHRLSELTDRAFAVVAPALDAPAGPRRRPSGTPERSAGIPRPR